MSSTAPHAVGPRMAGARAIRGRPARQPQIRQRGRDLPGGATLRQRSAPARPQALPAALPTQGPAARGGLQQLHLVPRRLGVSRPAGRSSTRATSARWPPATRAATAKSWPAELWPAPGMGHAAPRLGGGRIGPVSRRADRPRAADGVHRRRIHGGAQARPRLASSPMAGSPPGHSSTPTCGL